MHEIDIVNACRDTRGTEVDVFLDILIVKISMDIMQHTIHWRTHVNVVMDIDSIDELVWVIIQFVRNYMVGAIIIIHLMDTVKHTKIVLW